MSQSLDKQFKFLGWSDIDRACLSLYSQMHKNDYVPDVIIGLLRGGVIPARIMADYFGIMLGFFALDVKLYTGIGTRMGEPVIRYDFKDSDIEGKKILVVDDILDSGRTMNAVLEQLKGNSIATATLFWKETAKDKRDYYAETSSEIEWIVYPWETMEFKREMQTKIGDKAKMEKPVIETHRKF